MPSGHGDTELTFPGDHGPALTPKPRRATPSSPVRTTPRSTNVFSVKANIVDLRRSRSDGRDSSARPDLFVFGEGGELPHGYHSNLYSPCTLMYGENAIL